MTRRRIRSVVLLLIIASLLAAGCSADTPKPSKPNTEVDRKPAESVPPAIFPDPAPESNPELPEAGESAKPEVEESAKPAPGETQTPDNEDKKDKEIIIPDWAIDKSYRNHRGTLHFNEAGIPNLPVTEDISITEATEEKIVVAIGTDNLTIAINEDSSIAMNGSTLYPDIDGPEWLKGKTYQGMVVLEFDDRGLLSSDLLDHKLSHISSITEDSVTYVIVSDDEATRGDLKIVRNADPLLIDVEVEGTEFQLQQAEEI